jgi:hypothetical protein
MLYTRSAMGWGDVSAIALSSSYNMHARNHRDGGRGMASEVRGEPGCDQVNVPSSTVLPVSFTVTPANISLMT